MKIDRGDLVYIAPDQWAWDCRAKAPFQPAGSLPAIVLRATEDTLTLDYDDHRIEVHPTSVELHFPYDRGDGEPRG